MRSEGAGRVLPGQASAIPGISRARHRGARPSGCLSARHCTGRYSVPVNTAHDEVGRLSSWQDFLPASAWQGFRMNDSGAERIGAGRAADLDSLASSAGLKSSLYNSGGRLRMEGSVACGMAGRLAVYGSGRSGGSPAKCCQGLTKRCAKGREYP